MVTVDGSRCSPRYTQVPIQFMSNIQQPLLLNHGVSLQGSRCREHSQSQYHDQYRVQPRHTASMTAKNVSGFALKLTISKRSSAARKISR